MNEEFSPNPRLRWDLDKGRPVNRSYELDPFQNLDTPYRVRRAVGAGAFAALMLCVTNILSAMSTYFVGVRAETALGEDRATLVFVHLVVSLVALSVFTFQRRRGSRIVSIVLMLWSFTELFPSFTYGLYGHGTMRLLAGGGFLMSLVGVRACFTLHARRAETDALKIRVS